MVKHYVTGQDALISLAGPANKQGRIIADNICGGDSRYLGSQGSSVIKVFDITAATTGINETNAKKAGLDVDKVILSPMSHAGYYPGGKLMTMKVVFEKGTCRLLGGRFGLSRRKDIPKWMKSKGFRYGFLVFFFAMFFVMLWNTYLVFAEAQDLKQVVTLLWTFKLPWQWGYHGTFLHPGVAQFAFGFYSVMLTSTVLGLITMVLFKPRSWCVYCPMGTMTQLVCKARNSKV